MLVLKCISGCVCVSFVVWVRLCVCRKRIVEIVLGLFVWIGRVVFLGVID